MAEPLACDEPQPLFALIETIMGKMPGARFKNRPGRAQTQLSRAGVFLGEDGKAEPISPAGVFSQAAAVAGKTPQQRRAREFLID